MSELPEGIDVLGFDYKVKSMSKKTSLEYGASGLCFRDKKVISIYEKGTPADAVAETLLHEVMHAVYFEMGITEGASEETTVRAMSRGLYAVLRANPALAQTLVSSFGRQEEEVHE